MKEKTLKERLEALKLKGDSKEITKLKNELKQKKDIISKYRKAETKGTLSSTPAKFLLTTAGIVVLGIGGWLFYSQALPRIRENRIEKYKTLQEQVITLTENQYYKEADELNEKIQRRLRNSSNQELMAIYNNMRIFDDERINPYTRDAVKEIKLDKQNPVVDDAMAVKNSYNRNFSNIESLVEKEKWRDADQLSQDLLSELKDNKNLAQEYQELFKYYHTTIQPVIDDLNEKIVYAERNKIYESNKDKTDKVLIFDGSNNPYIHGDIKYPIISPDNRHIAFLAHIRDIYIVDMDGKNLVCFNDWIRTELDIKFWYPDVKDSPPSWIDNDTLSFQSFNRDYKVKFYAADIDEHNIVSNLREYNP